jgi:hypothetical protein
MDFYHKYINPSHTGNEVIASFSQGARFAVSRETIFRKPKVDYQRLLATVSKDIDPYAGYFMEWLWSELFLGHQEPCAVPAKVPAVTHFVAMETINHRFPESVQRQEERLNRGTSSSVLDSSRQAHDVITPTATTATIVSSSNALTSTTTVLDTTTTSTTVASNNSLDESLREQIVPPLGPLLNKPGPESIFAKSLVVQQSTLTTTATTIGALFQASGSHILESFSKLTTATTTGVLFEASGMMKFEVDAHAEIKSKAVEECFKQALDAALKTNLAYSVKVIASDVILAVASRRLQTNPTKRFKVQYLVSATMSAKSSGFSEKLNHISRRGTPESSSFLSIFAMLVGVEPGVVHVRLLQSKLNVNKGSVYNFLERSSENGPLDNHAVSHGHNASRIDASMIISGIAASFACLSALCTILIRRRIVHADSRSSLLRENVATSYTDAAAVHSAGKTLLQSRSTGQPWKTMKRRDSPIKQAYIEV